MKKPKKYGAYIFAVVWATLHMIANKFFSKPDFILFWVIYILILIGLWKLIETLLYLPNRKVLRWVYMIICLHLYFFMIIVLDIYVLHLLMKFTKYHVLDVYIAVMSISSTPVIFIESMRWMRENEQAQVENLTLQAENIEANFQLLKEQVNPDFLFYCLHQLQKMAKIEDPNMENYILKLADVYRQFLKKDTHSHILGKEIALFQSYVYLICYGRETTLSVVINVSDVALDRKIPLFALQMFADNYIKKHALSEKEPLHLSVYQKEAESITITHNQAHKMNAESMNTERLEICYHFEGVENGVKTEKEGNIYSTTLSLF